MWRARIRSRNAPFLLLFGVEFYSDMENHSGNNNNAPIPVSFWYFSHMFLITLP